MEERDAAEYCEASYVVDFAAHCDGDGRATATAYREASERLMRTLNKFITFFYEHGYSTSKTLWGVAYATGHPLTAGMSILQAARMLGCTKQAISKVACDFLEETGLPPSPALKTEEARKKYKVTNGNRRNKTGGN
jgi:hypothetical protein